ncbi:peptidylprolyl isomerase [uncultured Clostridium sp.]|uniref:peptidylprolyl isomerase n=1 Tax=uncultured Clostridium sp. TaxID=59620 RepID=UPI003217AB10
MIKLKKILAGLMASTLMFSAVGCGMIEKTEEGISKTVVAKVYKEKITLGEVDSKLATVYERVKAQYGENYKENSEAMEYIKQQRLSMLDTMVNDIIIKNNGEKLKVVPSDEEVQAKSKEKLDEIKKSFKSDEEYKNALKAAGVTEESFLEELKPAIISNAVYEEVVKDVAVTDEEIKTYYDSNQNSYTESPNKVKPAHILVKTEEEAKDIIARLDKGEDFAKLAAEKGTDATKDKGGDLGWIEYTSNQYDKTFLMSAISLKKGEYTKTPVSTKFGFHVIKCLDKEEYPVKPLEEVKEDVKDVLLEQNKYNKWVETVTAWQKDADIKLYEDKLS